MPTYARIADGRVAELIQASEDGPSLQERYHPDIVAACVLLADEQAAEVQVGYLYDGDAFAPPPPLPPPTAEQARARRNALLTACDWTQLPDAPLTSEQRAAWQTYRQALRDVPQQPGFPEAVAWPVPPAAGAE